MAIKPLQTITLKNDNGEDITYTLSGEYPDLTAGAAEQIISDEYTENKVPYLLRASGGNGSKREDDTLVGGTVAWNQLLSAESTTTTNNGVTFTGNGNGSYTLTNTATGTAYRNISVGIIAGHKYYLSGGKSSSIYTVLTPQASWSGTRTDYGTGIIASCSASASGSVSIQVANGTATGGTVVYPQIIDLTQMFGSTIADYIYSLEQTTTGAGVAWFRNLFPAPYYSYNSGELMSVSGVSAHLMKDADDNVVGNYPLDDSLTLRGIPKLDANNSLYYDGDTYESDGTVTRKYGIVTLNGDTSWSVDSGNGLFYTTVSGAIKVNAVTQLIPTTVNSSGKYMNASWGTRPDKSIGSYWGQSRLYLKDSEITTTSALQTELTNNPITVVYMLNEPTTETADPYTNPQTVDADGTEEYVSTSIVPVGHETKYFADLVERLAAIPEPPTSNGTYRLIATVSGGVATLSWTNN